MTPGNTPTPPTQHDVNPQKHRPNATDASTDATDTPATDTGGPLLVGADGGANAPARPPTGRRPSRVPVPPPPCPERCWEPIGAGWAFTDSALRCGHTWDAQAGVWRVMNHPIPPATREAAHR